MNNNIVQLHSACSDGNVSRVQFLLSLAGWLDPNAQNRVGFTPLMKADRHGQEGVVALASSSASPPLYSR